VDLGRFGVTRVWGAGLCACALPKVTCPVNPPPDLIFRSAESHIAVHSDKLQLIVTGSVVITANVQDLTTTVFDQALLLPPKGAIERRQCSDMKHAVPMKTPDPMYPKSASQNKRMGDTTVAMTVLTDGSVTDIRLIGTATRSMDDATLQTLKGWKFKPAMCSSEPVVSDIEVVVSFRLQ
jgi:TonB family protein